MLTREQKPLLYLFQGYWRVISPPHRTRRKKWSERSKEQQEAIAAAHAYCERMNAATISHRASRWSRLKAIAALEASPETASNV